MHKKEGLTEGIKVKLHPRARIAAKTRPMVNGALLAAEEVEVVDVALDVEFEPAVFVGTEVSVIVVLEPEVVLAELVELTR